ncbi:MAG: DNA topoisomerase 3 [Pseudomonadota bacterium]
MRSFIAEKPSVARAIADVLGSTGKSEGFIQCGTDTVTWCFGHMLELASPDDYTPEDVPRTGNGKKIWRVDDLPIIPKEWVLRPKPEAKKQLAVIGRLIRKAGQIVNAGDPDREGQLLIDEVLEHFCNTKPVVRFWVSAQDAVSIQRGLAALKENTAYHGWADAARARQRADWLIGMNLSRAYTLRAQRSGSRVLLTVGRVQTPTLALIVMRDREIESFTPVPYYTIRAETQHAGGNFTAIWKAKKDQAGLDSEGRLIDRTIADTIVQSVTDQSGSIVLYRQEAKKQNQPLVFTLSDITLLASGRYGYSAEEVLNICQALYETHKLTSYPRTDCPYLPESQHADAPLILDALRIMKPELARLIDAADPGIKSRTWNDAKITAHHGIIPTMHKGNKEALNDRERNIYDLIVRVYLAQFYPLHEYLSTNVEVDITGISFTATGKVVTRNGWRDVFDLAEAEGDREIDECDKQQLPAMAQGDAINCIRTIRKDAQTKPPSHFTEGALVRAMENVHANVVDPTHKKMLREGDGIGTSATRASVISELKRRGFLETKGKKIISSTLGRSLIGVLPEVVTNPVLTAIYERILKGVEQGKADLHSFVAKQESFIREQVAQAGLRAISFEGSQEVATVSALHKCMACGSGLTRRPGKKKGQFWWGCSNFPTCRLSYPDLKGHPDYSRKRQSQNNRRIES